MKPVFPPEFFVTNRKRLAEALPNACVVIPAHSAVQYSADIAYPFRQDSSFWYLCGLKTPDDVLVIDTHTNQSFLFRDEQTDYQKQWEGESQDDISLRIGQLDELHSKKAMLPLIRRLHRRGQQVVTPLPLAEKVEPYGFWANPARAALYQQLRTILEKEEIGDVRSTLARLRSVKQPIELAAIKQAVAITTQTLQAVQKTPESTEQALQRAITVGFVSRGADDHAYDPIIASGKNAAIIHYTKNCDKIAKNSFLLLDVGAKYQGYCADISRTWFVGENISKRQKDLYAIVCDIQQFAFSKLKAGVVIKEYQKTVEAYALQRFKQVKLPQANQPYPHGFSHFLGLDVHDAGLYDEPLQPGMVITVEPGLYAPQEALGIRIEDDVLITRSGYENLSADLSSELLYWK